MTAPPFTVSASYNGWLPEGGTAMDAVVTVACETTGPGRSDVAEVIVIDRSSSMYGAKLAEARHAATEAVGVIRDGAYFALVAGGSDAVCLYPDDGTLALASDETRARACAAAREMSIGSTTNTGLWLKRAADILATRPGAIGHVLLLTDGRVNQHSKSYDADLAYCRGRFTCDSVGIGLDWDPGELERIAGAFLGSFAYCEELSDLASHFTEVCGRTMGKAVGDVELRLHAPQGTEVAEIHQMFPDRMDLIGHLRPISSRAWAFPLASWGSEEREYLIRVAFPPTRTGQERRVRAEITAAGEVVARVSLGAQWTTDRVRYLAMDPKVAHHLGQSEISDLIGDTLRALDNDDFDTATQAVGEAWGLAEAGGFEYQLDNLARIAERDPDTRSVRLRDDISRSARLSTATERHRTQSSRAAMPSGEES